MKTTPQALRIRSGILTPDEVERAEIVYVTTRAEAREILSERDRYAQVMAEQTMWLVAFLQRQASAGLPASVEFSPEAMQGAAARVESGPLYVARSNQGGLRISLNAPEPARNGDGEGDAAGGGVKAESPEVASSGETLGEPGSERHAAAGAVEAGEPE